MRRATYQVEHEVSADHWWFRGRRRILTRLVADLPLPRASDARILDAGCGTGANTPALAKFGRVFGVDASPVPLSLREDRRAGLARLEHLPFASGSFDLVAALDLLEHLDDDLAGVRELGRVLSPKGRGPSCGIDGGWLLVFVPAFEQLWGLQDDVSHHRRRYTAQSLRSLLTRAGLRVRRLSYFNTALFFPILAARLAMRVVRPPVPTENNLTTPALNRLFGAVFGAEAAVLQRVDLPLGVSLLALAQR